MTVPATKSRGPLWLRAVHRLERTIGEPLECALHSDTYFDLVTELLRVKGRTERNLEGISRRLLHLLNLPASSDIRRGLMPTSLDANALSAHARSAAPGMVRTKKKKSAATTANDNPIAHMAWRTSTPPRTISAGPGVNSGIA